MTDGISALRRPVKPYFHWLVGTSREIADLESGASELGLTARVLSGHAMRTVDGMFEEFAKKLDFPSYFGRNWPAFDECLADLGWLPGAGYTIIIANTLLLLDAESSIEMETLATILQRVAEEWARPVALGEAWDRPAVPFHLVLQVRDDELMLTTKVMALAGVRPELLLSPKRY